MLVNIIKVYGEKRTKLNGTIETNNLGMQFVTPQKMAILKKTKVAFGGEPVSSPH